MDVTAALALVGAPIVDGDPPDATDPAVAAAFTAVLTGMLTTPPPSLPADGAAPDATVAVEMVAPPITVTPLSPMTAAPAAEPAAPGWSALPAGGAASVTVLPAEPITTSDEPAATAPAVGDDPDERAFLSPTPLAGGIQRAPEQPAPTTLDVPSGPPAPQRTATNTTPVDAGGARAPVTAPVAAAPAPAPDLGQREHSTAGDSQRDPTSPSGPAHLAAKPHTDQAQAATPTAAMPAPPATRALERALAAQLVDRIGRVVERGDGSHELSIELEPADLGRLEVRVRLEAGVVHVQVDAHARGTSDLLRRALPELREALAGAGLSAGALDIGDHHGQGGLLGGRPHGHSQPQARELDWGAPDPRARVTAPAHRPLLSIRSGADRGVDVLL